MYKFIIPLFALAFLLVSCARSTTDEPAQPDDGGTPSPAAMSALEKARREFDGVLLKGKHNIVLHTTKGDIAAELDADAAPKTVTNFILLARAGYYDNLIFHRVMPNFMIQGGDPNGTGTGGESIFGATFEDEINANSYGLDKKTLQQQAGHQKLPPQVANVTVKAFYEGQGYSYNDALTSLPLTKGAFAMANRGPNTNGSQFFVVQAAEVPWLDGRHTVFGKVTSGQDVVDAIVNVPRNANDKPDEAVTFTVEVK